MKTVAEMEKAIAILRLESKKWDVPVVTLVANTGRNPFRVPSQTDVHDPSEHPFIG